MSSRFVPTGDGPAFRRTTFDGLTERYGHRVSAALDVLGGLELGLPAIAEVHADQLRPALLFRHALPFCVTEDAFFGFDGNSDRLLAALLAGHTLALSHLDYHFDGTPPDVAAGAATPQPVELATAVAYSLRVLYAAGRLAADLPGGARLFADAFDPVSGFVLLRMYADVADRYSDALLDGAHLALDEYLTSETSRLYVSGYWEVMVRGSFAGRGLTPPDHLIAVARCLRRLRQAVDEVDDFDEDVTSGLITTPLLYALDGNDFHGRITALVRRVWGTRDPATGSVDPGLLADLRAEVVAAGGFDRAARLADAIWREGVDRCDRDLGSAGGGFVALLDLKRAKLAELLPAGTP